MLGRRKETELERIETPPSPMDTRPRIQEQSVPTVLSMDTHFKGSLTFEKSLRIEGNFEGDITTSGSLYIGKEARVKAEIKAGSIYIDGSVHGNITAHEKIELRGTSKVYGDLKGAKLVVEEGAALVGHCEINASSKPNEKEQSYNKNLGDLLNKTPIEVAQVKK